MERWFSPMFAFMFWKYWKRLLDRIRSAPYVRGMFASRAKILLASVVWSVSVKNVDGSGR